MQSSGGWDDVDQNPLVASVLEEKEGQDPSPGVVAQVLSQEEEEGFSQDDIILGSCEPAHREPSLPWTKITGKNLNVASSCKIECIVIDSITGG